MDRMSSTLHEEAIRDGYATERETAKARRKSLRALRAERQAGRGPPYTRDARDILYPIDVYRRWFVENTHQPVRVATAPPSPVKRQVKRRTRPSEPGRRLDRRHACRVGRASGEL